MIIQMSKRNTLDYYSYIFFFILVFIPTFEILRIPGFYSSIRLDIILSLILAFCYLLRSIVLVKISRFIFYLIPFVCLYVILSDNLIVSIVQILTYVSIYYSFILGRKIGSGKIFHNDLKWMRFLLGFSFILISFHIFYVFFKFPLFGRYAGFDMPFKFSIILIALTFLIIYMLDEEALTTRYKLFLYLFLCLIAFSIVTSDSRIGLICFIFFILISKFYKFILIIPFIIVGIFYANEKMIMLLSLDWQNLLLEPSIAMRYDNLIRYLSWVNYWTFFLPNGGQSFLIFSRQYGIPGPLDFLYLRILVEWGFIASLLFIFYIMKYIFKSKNILFGLLCALFIYSLVNEGIVATRSGHLVFFIIGFYLSKNPIKNYKYNKNISQKVQLFKSKKSFLTRNWH